MPLRDELNGFLRLPREFFGIQSPKEGVPDVGVLGIPYDLASSYFPGSRFGPDAIRQSTDGERAHSYPLRIGYDIYPFQKPLSKLISLEDIGDLEIVSRPPESAYYDILEASAKLAKFESKLLFLGGDHFITYPLIKGVKKGRPGEYGLIYIDAHADLYESFAGHQYSHATTLYRIISDKVVKIENLIAHDLRAALPKHRSRIEKSLLDSTSVYESLQMKVDELQKRVDHIYLSIDIDVLRPEIAPGVGHPESGGLDIVQLFKILRIVFETKMVQSVDLVELNPLADRTGTTAVFARDIVKEVLTGFARTKHKV